MSSRYIARHLYAGMPQRELIAALRETMEALERADASLAASEQRRRFGDALTAGEPWPTDLSNVQSGQLLKIVASGELTTLPPTAPDTIIAFRFEGTPTLRDGIGNLDLQGDYTPSSSKSVLVLQSTGERYIEVTRAEVVGGSLPSGTLGQTLSHNGTGWAANSELQVVPSSNLVTVANDFLVGGSVESTGTWAVHGSNGSEKISVRKVGPGALIFAVDTDLDRVRFAGAVVVARRRVLVTPDPVRSTDYFLALPTNSLAFTITLPAANAIEGRILIFKDEDWNADVNNITITPAGADTIDFIAGSLVLTQEGASVTLISNGVSNWEVS